ncbi:hypothetical protein TW65_09097, partial [Stemphylium lycopersici]
MAPSNDNRSLYLSKPDMGVPTDEDSSGQDQYIATCAARILTLPREVRDEIYKHIWDDYRHQSHVYIAMTPNSMTQFAPMYEFPGHGVPPFLALVGQAFASEAVEWFFDNGCLGQYVAVDQLGSFLLAPFPGVPVTPASRKLRFLNVHIDSLNFNDVPDPHDQAAYCMQPHFAALLSSSLATGFRLQIHVIISYHDGKVDARRIPEICRQLKKVVEEYENKSYEVDVCFDFVDDANLQWPIVHGLGYAPLTGYRRLIWFCGINNSSLENGYASIEGRIAKVMLNSSAVEWTRVLIC